MVFRTLVLAAVFVVGFCDLTVGQCQASSCDASARRVGGLRKRLQERRAKKSSEDNQGDGIAKQTLANFLAPQSAVEKPTQKQEDRFDRLFAVQAERDRLEEQRRRADVDRAAQDAMRAEFNAKIAEISKAVAAPEPDDQQPVDRKEEPMLPLALVSALGLGAGILKIFV